MYILMYFLQKPSCGTTLPTLPLLLGFTAIIDHLRAGEASLGCGLQCGAAPLRIPISFWSWAAQSGWVEGGSQSGPISCSF
jgi:hypothetical protein